MVAIALEKAGTCPSCGVPDYMHEEDPHAYVAVQQICPWCAMKDRKRLASKNDTEPPGASIKLIPMEVQKQREQTPQRRPQSLREKGRTQ